MEKHWTQRSIKDYIYKIADDFVSQLEDKMESEKMSQDDFATRLKKTKGRVSQILNKPGNMKLETMIECAQALGLKVSIVAYEDKSDPNNEKGPINSDIFKICWEKTGEPRDFWAVAEIGKIMKTSANPVNIALSYPENPHRVSFYQYGVSDKDFGLIYDHPMIRGVSIGGALTIGGAVVSATMPIGTRQAYITVKNTPHEEERHYA